MIKCAVAFASLVLIATPTFAQAPPCKFLCAPTLLVEPTITWVSISPSNLRPGATEKHTVRVPTEGES